MSTLKIYFKSGKTVKIRFLNHWSVHRSNGEVTNITWQFSPVGVLMNRFWKFPIMDAIRLDEIVFMEEVLF